MILKSKTSYFIGFNFEIHTQSRMDYKVMQSYIDNNPDKEWLEDLRLPCVSEVTHDNVTEHIVQYTAHYGRLMANNATIMNYLDFGFIPVAFYPTCYSSENEKIDRLIEALGVSVHRFPALYAGDVRFRNAHTDSWVSRFDASAVFGVPPEEIRTLDILRRLVRCETA